MTVRNIARYIATIAVVLASAAAPALSSAQRTSRRETRCSVHWSAPRPVRVGTNTAFVDRAAMISLRGRALFVGARAFAFDSLGNPVQPLLPPGARYVDSFDEIAMGAMSDGRGRWDWISEPPHARGMPWYPKAVADSSGVAHVVWASSDTLEQASPPTVPSIWYARFDGEIWSEPVHLAWGHKYYWSSANVSQLLLIGGTLHFVVSTFGEGLTYVRGSGKSWKVSVLPIDPKFIGYPSLAVLPNDRVVLIVQGAGWVANRNGLSSGVWATRSSDGGATWTPPRHVSSANAEPAYDFQLLADSSGTLHALWFQQTDSSGNPAPSPNLGNSPGRIYIAQSNDGGASWQQWAPTSLLANADGLQAVRAADGSVLATLADRAAEQVLVARWKGRWFPFAHIDAAPDPSHPVLGWGDAQRPTLTWGSRRTHDWYTTVGTTLTLCR